MTVDAEGKPTLTLGLGRHARIAPALEEVLETPAKIASKSGPRVVIVLDEFQQILEYGSDHLERKLRSVIQNHRRTSYLFLGSRKHLIQKMVLDRNRPLSRRRLIPDYGPVLPVMDTICADRMRECSDLDGLLPPPASLLLPLFFNLIAQ